jgi:hypothetical protein
MIAAAAEVKDGTTEEISNKRRERCGAVRKNMLANPRV